MAGTVLRTQTKVRAHGNQHIALSFVRVLRAVPI